MTKRPVVLVVDDEQDVLDTTAFVIEGSGVYDVIALTSFDRAAAHLAEAGSIDVLVSDYRLRGARSGLELCEIAVGLSPYIGIVLISAEQPEEVEPRPRRAVFLRKPFGVSDLLQAVEAALRAAPAIS